MEILMTAAVPVPLSETFAGLVWFPALCVMDKGREDCPNAAGENRTTTDFDWLGIRLKAPPPETTENGVGSVPTLPVSVPVELL